MTKEKNYYVLKYALTQGINRVKGAAATVEGKMLVVQNEFASHHEYYHGKGREWTDDFEEAIKIAEKMKGRKIESLKRQIDKLEKLTFDAFD